MNEQKPYLCSDGDETEVLEDVNQIRDDDEMKIELDIEFMIYVHSNGNRWSAILMKPKTSLNEQPSSLPIVISCQRWLSVCHTLTFPSISKSVPLSSGVSSICCQKRSCSPALLIGFALITLYNRAIWFLNTFNSKCENWRTYRTFRDII